MEDIELTERHVTVIGYCIAFAFPIVYVSTDKNYRGETTENLIPPEHLFKIKQMLNDITRRFSWGTSVAISVMERVVAFYGWRYKIAMGQVFTSDLLGELDPTSRLFNLNVVEKHIYDQLLTFDGSVDNDVSKYTYVKDLIELYTSEGDAL